MNDHVIQGDFDPIDPPETAYDDVPEALAAGDDQGVEPLVDPASVGVADLVDTEPAPRRWLLDGVLPLGIVGMLAAGGGTGKSFLSLQLAISVCTGRPWLGIDVSEPGGVLYLAAEDERDEIHRRLRAIVEHYRGCAELSDADLDRIRERLFVASLVGRDDIRLTEVVDRQVIRTRTHERIAALVEELPGVKLVNLDPASRFRGGTENDNDHATRFVEAVEALRAAVDATILLPHHVPKESLRAGADDGLELSRLRGATALGDAIRWAAVMATLRRDEAKDYGVEPDEASHYVRLAGVKNSYAHRWPGLWLERTAGGVLVPTDLEAVPQQRKQERRAEDRYREVLPKLKGLIAQCQENGEPMTRRRLRDYAGKSGLFGVGDQTLRGIVERALAEGEIRAHPLGDSRNTVELRTW